MKTVTYDETLWQLVPKKVTLEMINAFSEEYWFRIAYEAMLAEAPAPPEQPQQESEIAAEALTWEHVSNEWADELCNAKQWLSNVREGIATFDDALSFVQAGIDRCRTLAAQKREAVK